MSLRQFFSVLFAISFLVSCEDSIESEVFENRQKPMQFDNPDYELSEVSGYEIPEIIEELANKLGKPAYKSSMQNKIFLKSAIILTYAGKKVKTKKRVENYTFDIEVPGAPYNHIYNLVVEKKKGKVTNSYVIKYVVDEDAYESFIFSNDDLGLFSGMYSFISLDSFLYDSEIGKIGKNGDCTEGVIANTSGSGSTTFIPAGNNFQFDYQDASITTQFFDGSYSGINTYFFTATMNYQNSSGTTEVVTSSAVSAESLEGVFAVNSGALTQNFAWSAPSFGLQSFSVTIGPVGGSGNDIDDCLGSFVVTTDSEGNQVWQFQTCNSGGNQNKSPGGQKSTFCETSDGGIALSTVTRSVDKLSFWLDYYVNHSLTQHHYEWLMNPAPFPQSVAYEINQQIIAANRSIESVNIAREIVVSGSDGNMISFSPFVRYPLSKDAKYRADYPTLTNYLINELPKMVDNQNITDALQAITGLPLEQIKEELKWGHGPFVEIIDFENDGAIRTDTNTIGAFKKSTPDVLYLSESYIQALEDGSLLPYQKDALLFYMGVVVLHEYVHYGDYINGDKYPYDPNRKQDEGDEFECLAYGQDIGTSNYEWFYLNWIK